MFSQSKYVRACLCAAGGSSEDIGALSLALQIIDASEELQQTVAHLKKLRPGAPEDQVDQTQPHASGRLGSHSEMLCADAASAGVMFHASKQLANDTASSSFREPLLLWVGIALVTPISVQMVACS